MPTPCPSTSCSCHSIGSALGAVLHNLASHIHGFCSQNSANASMSEPQGYGKMACYSSKNEELVARMPVKPSSLPANCRFTRVCWYFWLVLLLFWVGVGLSLHIQFNVKRRETDRYEHTLYGAKSWRYNTVIKGAYVASAAVDCTIDSIVKACDWKCASACHQVIDSL